MPNVPPTYQDAAAKLRRIADMLGQIEDDLATHPNSLPAMIAILQDLMGEARSDVLRAQSGQRTGLPAPAPRSYD